MKHGVNFCSSASTAHEGPSASFRINLQASLPLAIFLQPRTLIFFRSFSTSPNHLYLGFSMDLFPSGLFSKKRGWNWQSENTSVFVYIHEGRAPELRLELDPVAVRVRFVVNKMTLEMFLLQALRFSRQYHSTNVPNSLILLLSTIYNLRS